MLADRERPLAQLRELHAHIRQSVVAQAERSTLGALAVVASEGTSAGARTFALDRLGEQQVIDYLAREIAPWVGYANPAIHAHVEPLPLRALESALEP